LRGGDKGLKGGHKMANINKCFKIHLDLFSINNLDAFINDITKISDVMLDNNDIIVWLNDDKDKTNLTRCLKKNKIKEYFCEQIEYETIGKDKDFNFISAWFMEKYRDYEIRKAEQENQDKLREMYDNIQRAQDLLRNINRDGDSLDDKQSNLKEAHDNV